MTGVALGSLLKIIESIVPAEAPNISCAMAAVARSLSHCRFEASDVDGDQSTLARILRCITVCITAPCGEMIPDESILELFETCFRLAVPVRSRHVSQMLRSLADTTIVDFISATFARFRKFVPSETASAASFAQTAAASNSPQTPSLSEDSSTLRKRRCGSRRAPLSTESPYTSASLLALLRVVAYILDLSPNSVVVSADDSQQQQQQQQPTEESGSNSNSNNNNNNNNNNNSYNNTNGLNTSEHVKDSNGSSEEVGDSASDSSCDDDTDAKCASEDVPVTQMPHLGFLGSLAGHLSQKRRAEAQYLGLSMASAIIDTCGPAMQCLPGFLQVLREDLLCAVLRLMDSSQPAVLAMSLRVFVNAYFSCKPLLKLHYEMFLARCFRMVLDEQGIQ